MAHLAPTEMYDSSQQNLKEKLNGVSNKVITFKKQSYGLKEKKQR